MNGWYDNLNKPPLTPPDWIFSPVWTVLYIMIALSFYVFLRSYKGEEGRGIYGLLAVHVISNLIWSPLFFGLQSPLLALLDIFILIITLSIIINLFRKIKKSAALLLCPYLGWVLFAAYLNAGIWILNR